MVLEMLLYSDEGFIKLLPAVPEDLKKGSVKGVWLYTFAKIEHMKWNIESGNAVVEISSLRDQSVEIAFPLGYNSAMVDGEVCSENGNGFYLNLEKNHTVKLEFQF